MQRRTRRLRALALLASAALACACATRLPYARGSCSELDAMPLDGEPQLERGRPQPLIDGLGHYVLSLPSKLLLLDWKIDDHRVSESTEAALLGYLRENGLCHVKVRINQYAVQDEFSRLLRNRNVHFVWRYSIGLLSVANYALFPQRLFGGDNYNPFTNTVSIYSDLPAVVLHEGGHAKDFAGRRWKGLYGAVRAIPLVPLFQEGIACNDAVSYLRERGDTAGEQRARPLLWAAYSSYLGGEGLRWYSGPEGWAQFATFPVAWIAKLAGAISARRVPAADAVPPPAPAAPPVPAPR